MTNKSMVLIPHARSAHAPQWSTVDGNAEPCLRRPLAAVIYSCN